jgi:Spy/CpxP family protein refolding chaperone
MSNNLRMQRVPRLAARVVATAAALVGLAAAPARADTVASAKLDSVRALPRMVVLAPAAGWPSSLLQGISLTQGQRVRLDSLRAAYAPRIDFGPTTSATGPSQPLSWGARLQLRMQQRNAIRSILTPPQRAIFDANAQRIRDRIQIRVPPRPEGVHRLLRFGLG